MFGLEPTQIEHLADQADIQALTSGSGGDPTNLQQVRQSEARFKDRVKQIVGNDYGVTLNPAQESVKVIPKKFFDPIADPNTLPGVDIPIGSTLDFSKGVAKLGVKLGGFLPAVGVGFDIFEAKQRREKAEQTENPLDIVQARIADVIAVTSPIPEPISQGINFVGGVANFVIDALRAPSAPVTDEDLEFSTM